MFSIHDIEFYNLYSYTKIPIKIIKKQLEDYDADNEQEDDE
jgi:hypothetical protein